MDGTYLTHDRLDDIKKKMSGATIGGWNIGEPEKTLEEKIEQVKIDMYKDRYKTYEVWSYVLYLCQNSQRNHELGYKQK